MRKKVFEACESILLAVIVLGLVVITIDCLSSMKIAIDDIAMEVYKGNAPLLLGLSIGSLFYIASCTITLAAAFGYIITRPSTKSLDDKQ